jgi:hypothetical protein
MKSDSFMIKGVLLGSHCAEIGRPAVLLKPSPIIRRIFSTTSRTPRMLSLLLFLSAGLLTAFVVLRSIRRTVVRSGPWMFDEIRRGPDIARDR